MFFVNKGISNTRLELKSYKFIDGAAVFSKTTCNICLNIICFKDPQQAFINHPFHGFTITAG